MNNPGLRASLFLVNLYPPFIGAGIRLSAVGRDIRYLRVGMPMRFYNKNLNGSHFGGSLYSMTDPWYIFILWSHLGPRYIYWDKAAKIEYLKPARTKVYASFEISSDRLEEIKKLVDTEGRGVFDFHAVIENREGDTIAMVTKKVYIGKSQSAE